MNTKYKISTTLVAATVAIVFLFPAHTVRAQAPEENCRFIFLGYRYVCPAHPAFAHNTHPDDSFLPDSGVPGSAGTTDLGGALHFFALGIGYQPCLSNVVSFNFDGGVLLGNNRDRRQNANDPRPAANAAFIYSQAQFGTFAAAGISYHIKGLSLGVEAQLASILMESGWDRYGSDKSQTTKAYHQFSAGPKIGYRWKNRYGGSAPLGLEATVQFNQFVTFGMQAVFNF